ncbi:LLM class flavin-dependent oxidoreductase [Streptomyces humi]|uniref:LLM class flavin-dependent oxidoreductase n=1 Tax=Streptomyces humi TaxID=1428620 RepID=UPI00062882BF|nr:LLM class flavin-dependent oxidoreductase [Streptomyces humi]
MSGSYGRGLLHLAAAVDQVGVFDAERYVELVRLAESGGLDFVTLDGRFGWAESDPLTVLSRLAPATRRIGLVPLAPAPQAAAVRLDEVSGGRAGWWSEAPGPVEECPVRVTDATEEAARRPAARYADVALVRAASSAQAAVVRDELRSHAREFGREPEELRVLVSLMVDLGDGERAAEPGHGGGGPRQTVQGPLYRGGPVDLAELIASWHAEGATDGFHLVPAEPRRDLERLVNGTVALLQHRGLFRTFYPGSTLREHLGLARRADQLAAP